MSRVIGMEQGRLLLLVKKGFRNWISRFQEEFDARTTLSDISLKTMSFLAQAQDRETFYLYDLIMALKEWGSGFEFNELEPRKKMAVIDQYLFLLDQIRFECMKRLGWLESYPGQDIPLVEMILQFEILAPRVQAQIPLLSPAHPRYKEYQAMNTFDRESFVRKLIPGLLTEMMAYKES
ncbi:MAG: hypothetical protein C4582_07855 [Desulfobacteraceae bacterium]|jgi:hypothetical protein|nr:MAG: hypothetical protein C4582_07855 [Desulfobacteraceae bacterium]